MNAIICQQYYINRQHNLIIIITTTFTNTKFSFRVAAVGMQDITYLLTEQQRCGMTY